MKGIEFKVRRESSRTRLSLAITALLAASYVFHQRPLRLFQSSLKVGHDGALASEHEVCTNIGLEFLRQGGNAADALISTVFCVGTVAMYHSGIGGGGYVLVRDQHGKYESILFKERAPAQSYETMFVNNSEASLVGGLASAVPGDLQGLEYLHKSYASFPWSELIQPSINLARYGFVINRYLASFMQGCDFLITDPSWSIDFAPDGKLKRLGDIITRKRYANTLQEISQKGADVFYHGEMAAATVKAVQDAGGIMTTQDLDDYVLHVSEPVQIAYRDFIITSNNVVTAGPQVLSIMKTIEGYESIGWPEERNLSTHRLDEAFRFSWGERVNMCDPLFNDTVEQYVKWVMSEEAAEERRHKISDKYTLDPEAYNPRGWDNAETHGTSAVVATDSTGLTLAWTSTVNYIWGSQVCVPATGIILNDCMNSFSNPSHKDVNGLPPSPLNYPGPGKRPQENIANLIVEHASNHSFYFATSTAGGSYIPTMSIQMLWHVLDRNLTAYEAIEEPRFHDQLTPNEMSIDWTFDNRTVDYLRERGHSINLIKPGTAVNQALRRRWDGALEAASDPKRRGGGVL